MPVRYEIITEPSLYRERLGQVSKLFSSVFERNFPASGWEQWYFGNPYGPPAVIMGYRGDELIAHSALVPQVLIDGGGHRRLSYRLSMSTMVDRRHRHVLVFQQIMGRLHEWARAEGAGFVLGFPNANSYLPAKVLFGYQTLLETPFLSWTPVPSGEPPTIASLPALSCAAGEYSYPADRVYWAWRMRNANGGRVLLDGIVELVYKTDGPVLTVLDLGTRRPHIEAKVLQSRWHWLHLLKEYMPGFRGRLRWAMEACVAGVKASVDCLAVAAGLQHRLLRHRARPLTESEMRKWQPVWDRVNAS